MCVWQGIMQRKTNERTDENHDSKRERMYELKDSPPRTTNSLIKQLCSSLQLNTTQPLYISMVHINKIILSWNRYGLSWIHRLTGTEASRKSRHTWNKNNKCQPILREKSHKEKIQPFPIMHINNVKIQYHYYSKVKITDERITRHCTLT